ncbi:hypothetical protein ISCGN_008113 [Ixodes scapularis]
MLGAKPSPELPSSGPPFGSSGDCPSVKPEDAARTSSNASTSHGQPEAMDTRNASNAGPATTTTGAGPAPASILNKSTMGCSTVFQFGEPSTVPSTAQSVELVVRALLSSISKESLIDIFKSVIGESHEIVPTTKGKKQNKSATSKKALKSSTTAILPAPAGAAPISGKTPQPAGSQGDSSVPAKTLPAPKPAAAAPPTTEQTEEEDGFTTVTSRKKRKRAREDPTQQNNEKAKPSRRWQFEYKIRLTRSQVSIKPLLPRLKTHLSSVSTAFTMHLLDKANTISVRTVSKQLAETLEKITEVDIGGQAVSVQVFRTYGTAYCKGVIYDIYSKEEDPQDNVLNLELESEKIQVVAARRLGKSNTAMLTFDGEKTPRSVLYGNRYMRVFPFKPKAVTCGNCHRLGHKPDICPNAAVCPICGTQHLASTDPAQGPGCPDSTPYCQGCRKKGHLGTDRKCPTWQETNKRMREDVKKFREQHKQQQQQQQQETATGAVKTPVPPSGTLWADRVKHGIVAPPPSPSSQAEIQELRNTCNYFKAELDRLKAIVQAQQEENNHHKSTLSQMRALTANIF